MTKLGLFSWLLPFLLFLACFGLYLSTLTQVHTFDALSYVLDVDRKPWQELFHPHHLAYGPLGTLVRNLALTFGYSGSSALPMQVTNALAGAAGATLLFTLVRAVTRRTDVALATALLLATSYAFWYYAIEVEVYTVAVLFLTLCLWLMVSLLRQPARWKWVALGIFQGLATLFHQTNVLMCVPTALLLWLHWRDSRRTSPNNNRTKLIHDLQPALTYGIPLAVLVGGSYVAVGIGVSGFRSVEQFSNWLFKYARTGWWGGPISGSKLGDLGLGLTNTLAQPWGMWASILLLALLLAGLPRLLRQEGRLVAVLVAWLLAYGAFFFWWEPDNIEFWIASLPPLLLLLALALSTWRKAWHAGVWAVLALGAAMLYSNGTAIAQRGDATNDMQRIISQRVAQASTPNDLLLVPDGLQELYLPYYEGRNNVYSLNQALFESENNWFTACSRVQERINLALRSGTAILIGDAVLQPELETQRSGPDSGAQGRGGLLERFGLTQQQISACFQPFAEELQPVELDPGLPRFYRLPSAQQRADGAGWTFSARRWGWQANNVKHERFENGWLMTPDADPWLLSPPMQLDTGRYRAIEIRMAATTAARDAQLFFLDASGQTDETRSVRWTLQPDPDSHVYEIELRGQPGWSGIISGLRLDPVGLGDGGTVRIESIRLVQ
ncbi:MAG: DUF2723 domain-containing protein [Chloroflexaceae bacterium]|nr:DUF2723 domain-containing protein [Chloroflexaceae bacterium]